MAVMFYWRRKSLFGAMLLLLGLALLIELIPLTYGQYFLIVDQPLILVLPSIGSTLVVFLVLMDLTEQYSQRRLVPIARLYQPILFAVITVMITRFLFFFASIGILIPVLINTPILDSVVLSYAAGQVVSIIACIITNTTLTRRILKR